VKNLKTSITEKLTSKYLEEENNKNHQKSTNINILLNRVKSNQKNENIKKIYFSAFASTGLILFGILVFY